MSKSARIKRNKALRAAAGSAPERTHKCFSLKREKIISADGRTFFARVREHCGKPLLIMLLIPPAFCLFSLLFALFGAEAVSNALLSYVFPFLCFLVPAAGIVYMCGILTASFPRGEKKECAPIVNAVILITFLYLLASFTADLLICLPCLAFADGAKLIAEMLSAFGASPAASVFLLLSLPLLYTVFASLCYAALLRGKRAKKRQRTVSPTALSFVVIYSLSLLIYTLTIFLSSFADVSFLDALLSDASYVGLGTLWTVAVLDAVSIPMVFVLRSFSSRCARLIDN